MNIVIFCGPTLGPADVASVLPAATCIGPAGCGDVYRASKLEPDAIGICDGYFDHRLSVWHKEILWALSRGIRVYGASSIGALRAAELATCGMIGVGRVFEDFASGKLVDDDEVAILHEPAGRGYIPRSDALVDIRATLDAAVEERVLAPAQAADIVAMAREVFYADRRFEMLPSLARTCGFSASEVSRLHAWLGRTPPVRQKRRDALAMLLRIKDDLAAGRSEALPDIEFPYTDAWHSFRTRMDAEPGGPSPSAERGGAAGATAHRVWSEALERALCLALAEASGYEPSAVEIQKHSDLFRKNQGLFEATDTLGWLAERHLSLEDFSRWMRDDLVIRHFREAAREAGKDQLPANAGGNGITLEFGVDSR